jgi:hypothetical protein
MADTDNKEKHLRRIDLPIYPKAFIAAARLSRERDRVFVIMPFEEKHSKALWKIIRNVCQKHGLVAHRADTSVYPNPIVADILEEIERAEIIIADLTGMNPNVLYEIGMAHVRCESVILVCKKRQKLPFDLASIRCIFFDINGRLGIADFEKRLSRTVGALKSVGPPQVMKSALDGTKSIIADLQILSSLSDEELSTKTIWFSGFLSSFAIKTETEAQLKEYSPDEREYRLALIEEKNTLLALARRGCLVRCIITPPSEFDLIPERIDYAHRRLETLIEFLNSNDKALKSIEWVVSPFRQKNVYIIDRLSCFEGYKKGIQSGYALTLRLSTLDAISANISLYEVLYDRLSTWTLTNYHSEPEDDHREALKNSTKKYLKQCLDFLNSKIAQETSSSLKMTSDGKAMAKALAKLAASGSVSKISDPSAWQREQRQDRPLPGRDT